VAPDVAEDEPAQRCYIISMTKLDWKECAAIETEPGRMAGQPVIKNSRVRPEDLLANRDQGVEWLAKGHGLKPEVIREVFAFYDAHKRARVPSPG
jgi:uncharacterized protein (DUF433 family)